MVRGSSMAVYLQTASLVEGKQKTHRQREASVTLDLRYLDCVPITSKIMKSNKEKYISGDNYNTSSDLIVECEWCFQEIVRSPQRIQWARPVCV